MDTLLKNTRDWLQTSTRRSFSAVLEEAKITPRQVEICELKFVKGLTNYQIAMQLNVSVKTVAGDIGLKLLRNGVAVPGAEATVTGATGDTYNISFATLLRVLPSCCVIDNNVALQVQATAAGTISNISLSVVKMA